MSKAPAPRLTISGADWLLILLLSILWGGAFMFGKVAVAEIPPLTLSLGRVGIAAVLLMVVVRWNGQSFSQSWSSYGLQGLLQNVIPFVLIFWGQRHIDSALTSILIATTPLFTVFVAHFLTSDEKITPARVFGAVAGFIGVIIVIGPDAISGAGAHIAAEFACLGASLAYALAAIYGRRFRKEPPLVVATGQLIASTATLAPIALLIDAPWLLPAPSAAALGSVLVLAALSTALAYIIYFRVLSRAGATNVHLVTFLMPVTAIALGILVLGESLQLRHLIGMAVIAVGLAAINGRFAGRFVRRSA